MRKVGCVSAYLAASALAQYRIVAIDGSGNVGYPSTSGLAIGATLGATASAGESIDVQHTEIVEVEVGAAGVSLTSRVKTLADGKIVSAASGEATVGTPLRSGVLGDIIPVILSFA